MGVREQYLTILAEDGRRVANRFAFASLDVKGGEKKDGAWSDAFYGMYGPDDHLPEDERMRNGNPANDFDPTGWTHHYTNHPADERSPMYRLTNGASKWAFDQLVDAKEFWGNWVILFLHEVAVLKTSNEVFEAIADDQGEFTKDGNRLCVWFAGWRGWGAWSDSLDAREENALRKVLTWVFAGATQTFTHKWPDPGTPEAEALIADTKGSK
ncbi:hypothetical protein [Paraburkholderia aspalathi]|uniref:hypothetical protein n=1 Tax=Paraburkholderia aspalathi TaxID=1324617 RepID=UPI003C82D6B8